MAINELALRAHESIKELQQTGFVYFDMGGRGMCRDEKESCVRFNPATDDRVTVVLHDNDSWDKISETIALAYNKVKEAEELYLYKISHPNPMVALKHRMSFDGTRAY